MAGIGLELTDVLLGLENIRVGSGSDGFAGGFGVPGIRIGKAEKEKMDTVRDELNKKAAQLKSDVTTAGNLYDHTYVLVAVNLERVKKALDKLPSDFVDKIQKQISDDLKESDAQQAINTAAKVMGFNGQATALGAGILQVVLYFRKRRAQGEEPSDDPTDKDPFDYVPLDGEPPPVAAEAESSFTATPKLDKAINGLNIAGIVFGVDGLAFTIGLSKWTLGKLDDAIHAVKKKQPQVTAFQTAMEKVLDEIVTDAGLPAKSYDDLVTMTATWKTISENFDSYEKSLYYAIRGYFMRKSLDDIKKMVAKESDAGKPFPDDGYPLANTLADDIKYMFDQKKTDKEIVDFFATDNPKIGLRFVLHEFFINALRWVKV